MNWSELTFSRREGVTIMDFITAVQSNLLSPAVLFFVLGVFAAVSKSDLKFPESLYTTLTIYLVTITGATLQRPHPALAPVFEGPVSNPQPR